MHDLNDWAYFAAVAEHGGFAAAGRALGVPKSKLSRRIAQLESDLGARLLHRTSRRFALTDLGQTVLRHAQALRAEAEAAEALVREQSSEPSGSVRLSCPPALLHYAVGDMLARFLRAWPRVQVQVQATNRNVDVWNDGVDIALRVRSAQTALPAEEIVRPLARSPHLIVAAPSLLTSARPPAAPQDLAALPTLGLGNAPDAELWRLQGPRGAVAEVRHQPRYVVDDMAALMAAALAGVGCATLPRLLAHGPVQQGTLLHLLPDWAPESGQIQAVLASRRGLRVAVRFLLDALVAEFAALIRSGHCLLP